MPATAQRLLADYSSSTLKRARNYARQGRVFEIDADAGAECLTARVRGTRPRPYKVTVDWSSGYAESDCTCPVGFDCKHGAAALLTFFGTEEPVAGRRRTATARRKKTSAARAANGHDVALTQWLGRLDAAGERAQPERSAPSNESLIYLLDIKERPGPPCLRVAVCRVRRRKDGSYGAAKRYNPQNTLSGQRARCVSDADMEMFYRLMQASSEAAGEYSLDREGNAALLTSLLETGRCHWASAQSPPLHPAPAREGTWEWNLDETGGQRLMLAGGPCTVALPLAPPWYVDIESGECGALQTDVPGELARALLQSPRLDPDQVGRAGGQLAERLPPGIPRPRILEVEARPRSPRPVLRLGADKSELRAWYGNMAGAWAELRFDYDGNEISAADRRAHLDRMQGERLLRIERDERAERKANDALDEFVPFGGYGARKNAPAGAMTLGNEDQDWFDFIVDDIPRLERDGWRIDVAADFPLQSLSDQSFDIEVEEGEDWFGIGLGIVVNGERINLLPLLLKALAELPAHARTPEALWDDDVFPVPLSGERTLVVPVARIKPILATLIELYDTPPLTEEGRLKLNRLDAARLTDLDDIEGVHWQGGKALKALGEKLHNFNGIKQVAVPRTFHGQLRDYQRSGLDWLQFLRSYEFNGILADDMGLGKTVQMLAHLLAEKRARRTDRPSLLVVPTSLLHNWRNEAARFAPSLRLLTLHGADRGEKFSQIEDHDLVLTTYPLLPRDAEVLKEQPWHYAVLDEAQVIKNPRTKAARIACELQARHRVCLTGTPMENHLGEMWSLFRFLMPGFLGDSKQFRRLYRTPIEKHGDTERREHLARRVHPFLLRRTKQAVAAELPPKTEMVQSIELEGAQRDLYESVRLAMHKKVRDIVAAKGLTRSHIEILEALLKLRQVCCDPRLLKGRGKRRAAPSAKLERLLELVTGLLADGCRVLLFSQFTEMLGLIERALGRQDIRYAKLTGRTRNRAAPIERFQSGTVPLMLVSLKAGGTGLNLTAADTVIHYDPWWNPAVEAQATDRAHRIGQDKPVFVYKLICAGTVEERIQALQQRKQALLQGIYAQGQQQNATLSSEDLQMLFEPLSARS
jgi:superfamily II DNA or RNA helicase